MFIPGVKPLKNKNNNLDTTKFKRQDAMKRHRMCRSKKAYRTEISALLVAAKCKDQYHTNRLRTYICPYCSKYHLTSSEKE